MQYNKAALVTSYGTACYLVHALRCLDYDPRHRFRQCNAIMCTTACGCDKKTHTHQHTHVSKPGIYVGRENHAYEKGDVNISSNTFANISGPVGSLNKTDVVVMLHAATVPTSQPHAKFSDQSWIYLSPTYVVFSYLFWNAMAEEEEDGWA